MAEIRNQNNNAKEIFGFISWLRGGFVGALLAGARRQDTRKGYPYDNFFHQSFCLFATYE
jgi:hypothetical protein